MQGKRRNVTTSKSDTLTLFFEDVARIPIVEGKADFLPLTRRIQRGNVLKSYLADSPELTYQKITASIIDQQKKLLRSYVFRQQNIHLNTLASDFELFLDDPDIELPQSISGIISTIKDVPAQKTKHVEDLLWDLFYLVSLVPAALRSSFPDLQFNDQIKQHFEKVLDEADAAKKRLVEGTLRWVISIARLNVGRGLPFLDLVQEGFFGLLRATETYDERSSHLQAYAWQWIRQRISRALTESANNIRVPVHIHEKVGHVGKVIESFFAEHRRFPSEIELFEKLDWLSISADDERYVDGNNQDEYNEHKYETSISIESNSTTNLAWARRLHNYYKMTVIPPYSFDSEDIGITFNKDIEGKRRIVDLHEFIIDSADLEDLIDWKLLEENLVSKLQPLLKKRDLEVILMRYGFQDGEEHTLEEIGQNLGLTRERIRQLESRAFANLIDVEKSSESLELKEYLFSDRRPTTNSIADRQLTGLLQVINLLEKSQVLNAPHNIEREMTSIEHQIQKYIPRGRRNLRSVGQRITRATLLIEALEELGQPDHYSVIHEKAMERTPEGLRFTREQAYSTLFYSDQFRSYKSGVFGLISWENGRTSVDGEKGFHHCPIPLLPDNPYPSAFFDSVIHGYKLLSMKPMAAEKFWLEMLAWAKRNAQSFQEAQDAFDTWYSVGLIEYIDFFTQKEIVLKLAIPENAKLKDIRDYCLNMLCRRVHKMSELLLALTRIPRPTVSVIQRVLYGSERAGYDVPHRLTLLASFSAVQQAGDEWGITEIGRTTLKENPPQELPDFSDVNMLESEDIEEQSNWEYEGLGLLEL